jgi:hypothetical protein
MIDEYELGKFLGKQGEWEVEGLQTEDHECAKCEEKLADGKWRGDEEKGVVLCRGCYHDKHGEYGVRGGTSELESPATVRPGADKSRESTAGTEDSVIVGPSERQKANVTATQILDYATTHPKYRIAF